MKIKNAAVLGISSFIFISCAGNVAKNSHRIPAQENKEVVFNPSETLKASTGRGKGSYCTGKSGFR